MKQKRQKPWVINYIITHPIKDPNWDGSLPAFSDGDDIYSVFSSLKRSLPTRPCARCKEPVTIWNPELNSQQWFINEHECNNDLVSVRVWRWTLCGNCFWKMIWLYMYDITTTAKLTIAMLASPMTPVEQYFIKKAHRRLVRKEKAEKKNRSKRRSGGGSVPLTKRVKIKYDSRTTGSNQEATSK